MASVNFSLQQVRAPKLPAAIAGRMRAPLPQQVVASVAGAIRRGPGSVEDQFRRQAEAAATASAPWRPSKPFGSRKAPSRTMHDRGALEAAWTGRGPGAVTIVGPRGVSVGVDPRRFPQSRIHQRGGVTLIRISPKSRAYVAAAFGVHLKKSTTHFRVVGRSVSLNRQVTGRVQKVVGAYYLHGETAGVAA